MAAWQILLAVIVSWFLGGCGSVTTVKALNGSFTAGLQGWEVYPLDRVSVVRVDKTLNLAMSSSEKVACDSACSSASRFIKASGSRRRVRPERDRPIDGNQPACRDQAYTLY
jgi:hypothetical protein